jgi:hypothetical protein
MAAMADQDSQDRWRRPWLAAHGRRTRIVVALLGCLLSVGTSIVALGVPGFTADRRTATRPPDDPATLGITGALPGNTLAGDKLPITRLPGDGVPGDLAGIGPIGTPMTPNLPGGPLGIPAVVLDAYRRAEKTLTATQPSCHLSWSVLAGIGRIESGHASGGRVDTAGNTLGPILGPRLDGSPGVAAIRDTDHGVLDTDTVWDRAVGPMQFIPSSWRRHGVDGNRDGAANPHNIYDSTLAAGSYLCAGGRDLSDPTQLQAALFGYNHSATYVAIVLRWAHAYLSGVVPTSSAPGPVPPGINGTGGLPIGADPAAQAILAPVAVIQAVLPAATPPVITAMPPAPPSPTAPPPPVITPTPPVMTGPPATSNPPGPPVTTTTPETTSNPPPPPSLTTDPPPTSAPLPTGP